VSLVLTARNGRRAGQMAKLVLQTLNRTRVAILLVMLSMVVAAVSSSHRTVALLVCLIMDIATVMNSMRQGHLTVPTTWQMSTPTNQQRHLREDHHQVLTTEDLQHQGALTGRHLHGKMTEENQVAVWQLEGQEMTTGVHRTLAGVQQTLTITESQCLTRRSHRHLALPDMVLHLARVLSRKVGHHRIDGILQSPVQVQEARVLVRELESQPGLLPGQCLV